MFNPSQKLQLSSSKIPLWYLSPAFKVPFSGPDNIGIDIKTVSMRENPYGKLPSAYDLQLMLYKNVII